MTKTLNMTCHCFLYLSCVFFPSSTSCHLCWPSAMLLRSPWTHQTVSYTFLFLENHFPLIHFINLSLGSIIRIASFESFCLLDPPERVMLLIYYSHLFSFSSPLYFLMTVLPSETRPFPALVAAGKKGESKKCTVYQIRAWHSALF